MIINRLYSKKTSSIFTIFKQIRELLFALRHNTLFKPKGTIWIHPHFPSRKTTLYKISRKLKFSLVTAPFRNTELGIYFSDSTFLDTESEFPKNINIINKFISDISKQTVDKIHLKIFGYNTIINPQIHTGYCVVKSNENARHDGTIIHCPITKNENDKIYQIIIDNKEDNLHVDYRVCVMKSDIIIVYKKYKTSELRFTNETCKANIIDPEMIPQDVQKKIISFCHEMQSEFCELDVLKDNTTEKWFIIDLNKTPYGPPASLSKKDKKKAVEKISNGFAKNFLN